jgi:hypothetical protein
MFLGGNKEDHDRGAMETGAMDTSASKDSRDKDYSGAAAGGDISGDKSKVRLKFDRVFECFLRYRIPHSPDEVYTERTGKINQIHL